MGNVATQDGGGVFSFSNLTIVDSTISGNTAGDDGGGLWIYNDDENFGERAIISNSTISGNTATGSGGGIYVDFGKTLIRHSTITQNTAAVGDGVLSRASSLVSTRFRSTIVADNTDNDDVASVGFGLSSILSDGYNLVGGGNSNGRFIATGDQSGVFDPQLLPLSDNGGPTPTHALLLGSPAHRRRRPCRRRGPGHRPHVRSSSQRVSTELRARRSTSGRLKSRRLLSIPPTLMTMATSMAGISLPGSGAWVHPMRRRPMVMQITTWTWMAMTWGCGRGSTGSFRRW